MYFFFAPLCIFTVTTTTACRWWMWPSWRITMKWSSCSSSTEPEKAWSVSQTRCCLVEYLRVVYYFLSSLRCDLIMTMESDGSKEVLSLHLAQLLSEAEKQLEEKSQPSSSPIRADLDKHVALWKRRVRILRKMKTGLEQLSEFSVFFPVSIDVISSLSSSILY